MRIAHDSRRRWSTACAVGVVAIAASSAACSPEVAPPPRTIRIITGDPSGTYHQLGNRLAALYTQTAPLRQAVAEPSSAMASTLRQIDEGTADLGFAYANTVYRAFTKGWPGPHRRVHLRGVAVLHTSAFHFVVRKDSPLESIGDLRGARLGIVLTSMEPDARGIRLDWISAAYGFRTHELRLVPMTLGEVTDSLASKRVDCVFLPAGFPDGLIAAAAVDIGIRLLSVPDSPMAAARAGQPFVRPVLIPGGVYPGQENFVRTIGFDNLLIAHDSLDENTVYELTKVFFEMLPHMTRHQPMVRQIDPARASATAIPLHPGAARYYRERQLSK